MSPSQLQLGDRETAEAEPASRPAARGAPGEAAPPWEGLAPILDEAARRALDVVGGTACAVLLLDPARGALVPAHSIGLEGRAGAAAGVLLETGVAARALAARAPVAAAEAGFPAALAVPLAVEGDALGVLVLYRSAADPFDHREVRLLALVAEHTAGALQGSRAREREGSLRRQVEAARAVAAAAAGEADAAQLLPTILRWGVELLGGASGTLYLWDEEAGLLVPRAWCGHDDAMGGAFLALGQGLPGLVASRREALVVDGDPAGSPATPQPVDRAGLPAAAAPLVARGRLLGVLSVEQRAGGRRFGAADREALAAFAAQAAVAAENAFLRAAERAAGLRLERQRSRADALAALGKAIAASHGLDVLFRLLVERAAAALGADAAAVLERDPATGDLRVRCGHGLSPRFRDELALPAGAGLEGLVLASRQPLWTAHALVDPRIVLPPEARAVVAAEGLRAMLVAPIRDAEDFAGVLCCYWRGLHLFQGEEIGFAVQMAEQAGLAVENAWLFQREQERRRQVEAVRAVSGEIVRELDLPALLGLINRRAVGLVGGDGGGVYLWDEAAQGLALQVGYPTAGWSDANIRPGEGLAGLAARERRGVVVNDHRHWPHADPALRERTRALAALAEPLLYRERLLGVILVTRQASDGPFTRENAETLALFAAQAAIALENARLYQEARNRARDLAALIQAGRAVTSSLDLTQILDTIVTSAVELTGAGLADLLLAEEDGAARGAWQACAEPLRPAYARAAASGPLTIMRDLSARVGAQKHSLWVPDAAGSPGEDGTPFLEAHGLRGYLGVPVLAQDRVLGVLSVVGPADGRPAEGRRELLESLAAQAALALENARLFARTREAFEELAAVQEAGRAIAESLDLPETLRRILAAAMRLTDTDKGIIWLLAEDRQELVAASGVGIGCEGPLRLGLGERALVTACLREGGVLVAEDPARDPRVSPALQARFGNQALIGVPLRSRDRVIGVLEVGDLKRRRRFTARQTGILERLAQQAVVAIENARLFGQVLRAKSEWEQTFDAISDLVAVVDLEGRVVRANRALLKRLGLPPGQVLRRSCADVLGDEGAGWGGCPHRRALRLGARVSLEVEDAQLGGTYSVGVFPMRDAAGEVMGTVHVARDITEQKALHARLFQADKLASIGTLAAGVAHHINNVLAAIVARADLLQALAADPETRRSAEVILQAAMDGAETVRRMQDFAKVKPPSAVGLVDVNRAVRDALELTQARWQGEPQGRGAPIRVETCLEAGAPIAGNPAEIREVLVNLILNAVDAMPGGGSLRLATADRPGGRAGLVEVRVEDTGVGMREAVRRRIFDPFFTTKGVAGTGLGLSVSYGLVAKNWGDIAVRSRPGEGSTFVLTFPAAGPEAEARPAAATAPGPRRGRVLVVEDEALVREALAEALAADGHQVTAMAGGREAIARFRPGAFDVVLTDLGMPEVSGLDVARAVKEADPSVHVILCTGWGNMTGADGPLLERGVDALLAKPFRVSQAVGAVRAGLETRSARDPAARKAPPSS